MFLELNEKKKEACALIDDTGQGVTYGAILDFAREFSGRVTKRSLIFVLNRNDVGAAMGYLGAMIDRAVPLMLGAGMAPELLQGLINIYRPQYLWRPADMPRKDNESVRMERYGYVLTETGLQGYPLHEELSLLLTTSGSTGSPKLVRHSYDNLEAQARNISAFFQLNESERPMLDLPINYTYGLSILNSHLYSGATVLLTSMNVLNPRYWEFLKQERATSFTNVPYAYEVLKKLRFFDMELPSLRTLSQGGGKLREDLHREFAQYAQETGRRFIVTYGQTEGSARMAWLPPEYALDKVGSIGIAIPGGRLSVVDEDGGEMAATETMGEMVYEGPNVTLGYAETGEDLLLGDERHGRLYTGDMVKRDEDGFFYIVGRKKRFLKLNGFRVGLDECENLIKTALDIECACVGNDQGMKIYVTDTGDRRDEIKRFIAEKTNLNSAVFEVKQIEKIPRNEAGKILYSELSA